jgi:hypothetical protein
MLTDHPVSRAVESLGSLGKAYAADDEHRVRPGEAAQHDQIAKFEQAKQSITRRRQRRWPAWCSPAARRGRRRDDEALRRVDEGRRHRRRVQGEVPRGRHCPAGLLDTSTTVVDETGQMTDAMGKATSAADILKAAFDSLNGVQLTQAEANIRWTETLKGVKVAADNGSKSST